MLHAILFCFVFSDYYSLLDTSFCTNASTWAIRAGASRCLHRNRRRTGETFFGAPIQNMCPPKKSQNTTNLCWFNLTTRSIGSTAKGGKCEIRALVTSSVDLEWCRCCARPTKGKERLGFTHHGSTRGVLMSADTILPHTSR